MYNHIKSKDELLDTICFRISDTYISQLAAIEATPSTYGDKIRALVRLHIGLMMEDSAAVSVANHDWKYLPEPRLTEFKEARKSYERGFAAHRRRHTRGRPSSGAAVSGTEMANTSSAKKAVRKIERRTAVNRMRRSAMRTQLRKMEEAIAAGDAAAAKAVLTATESIVMRSAQKGVIHGNTASRKVSRLAARVKALSAAPAAAAN